MNKRISRRELKNRIRELKYQNDQFNYIYEDEKKKRIEIENRFRALGSDPELEGLYGIPCIEKEVELQPWGNYAIIDTNDREAVEAAEERLVESIVKGLMEENIIRFIVRESSHSGGPFDDLGTVAARLYCIPWEQVTTRKLKINSFRGGTEE